MIEFKVKKYIIFIMCFEKKINNSKKQNRIHIIIKKHNKKS